MSTKRRNKNLLVYVDPGFLSEGGHYKSFSGNITNYCKRSHWEQFHYVNKNTLEEDVQNYDLKPLFDFSAYIPMDFTTEVVDKQIQSFSLNLQKIFKYVEKIHRKYNKIVFYMYTSHPLHIQAFVKISTMFNIPNSNVHLVLFYLDNKFCRGLKNSLYEELLSTTNESINDIANFFVHMDSDLAKEIYQPYFDKKLTILPSPLLTRRGRKSKNNKIIKRKKPIKIGYFGCLSEKHGFNLLFELIKRLDTKQYFFLMKINLDLKVEKEFLWRFKVLRVLPNVEVIERYVDNYFKIFSDCDLIILPYSIKYYPVQTSGVLIDSIRNKKQIITTEGTWLGEKVKALNEGVTFTNIDDLQEKIENYKYLEINMEKRKEFLKNYEVEEFFENIQNFKSH
jgi:hypothetical protein